MSLNVVSTLRSKSAADVARLINLAPQYVTDMSFVNLLNQYDLNSRENDASLERQFNLYAGNPQVKNQIDKWLSL
jgi:hypothetical protein